MLNASIFFFFLGTVYVISYFSVIGKDFPDLSCWFVLCNLIKLLLDKWHVNQYDNVVVV